MNESLDYPTIEQMASVSPCDYADALSQEQFINPAIKGLWPNMPRIAGKAFTVYCSPGDHLMLHAAIYEAEPGDILVVQADPSFAVAGGNVCAIAQKRGIAGMVVDGTIRDLAEVREMQFPVYARGVIPKPGGKKHYSPLNEPIVCGGVNVQAADIIIADEEGIAVVPVGSEMSAYLKAKDRAESDASKTLDEWQAAHEIKVQEALAKAKLMRT